MENVNKKEPWTSNETYRSCLGGWLHTYLFELFIEFPHLFENIGVVRLDLIQVLKKPKK